MEAIKSVFLSFDVMTLGNMYFLNKVFNDKYEFKTIVKLIDKNHYPLVF